MNIWECKIGTAGELNTPLPPGADSPLRRAVAAAYLELTGLEPEFIFSGWGAELDDDELAVIQKKLD